MHYQEVQPKAQNDQSAAGSFSPHRIAIIGAGPLGIEAAHYALSLGFSVRIFESENETAPCIRQWQHLAMFSPWSQLRTPLGADIAAGASQKKQNSTPDSSPELYMRDSRSSQAQTRTVHPTGEEFVRLYLEPLANALPAKTLYLGCKVTGITRAYLSPADHNDLPMLRTHHPFRIMTRNVNNGEERAWSAEFVLDCTAGGRVPAWMGNGGLPAIGEMGCTHQIYRHTPDILGRDRAEFSGKKTLLLGDGTSAATSALLLAELADTHEGTQFYWAAKSDSDLPFTSEPTSDTKSKRPIAFDKANLLIKSGKPYLAYTKLTQVEEIRYNVHFKKFFVTLQVDRQTKRYQFDNIIANVGTRREQSFVKQLLSNEPGFFAIGGEDCIPPENYLQSGHLQIREVFQTILGDRSINTPKTETKAA